MLDRWTLPPPPIRAMLIPDPGYVFVEADFSGADAQVVAWDANCPSLKTKLQAGIDLHTDNAYRLYGQHVDTPRTTFHINGMTYRDNAKRAVHAGNYDVTGRTLAASISIAVNTAEKFLHWWKEEEHPEVGEWHKRIRWELNSRTMPVIRNAFGFRRMYTDRPDRLLGQALAWIAQSTVGIAINHALLAIDEHLCDGSNWGGQLVGVFHDVNRESLQIHDSILMQFPRAVWPDVAEPIIQHMAVVIPYSDPLVIPSELKFSDTNWNEMQKVKL